MIGTTSVIRNTHKNATSSYRLLVFGMKSAIVFGLLVFSSTSSASISPLTPSINDCGLDHRERAAATDGYEENNDYDYDSVPWQPSQSNHHNIDEAARYEDMPPSVFSPTGRLHPVEAAFRASKTQTPLSNLLVAMRCRDGLVVVSTLPISPHVDARIAYNSSDSNTTKSNTSDDNVSNSSDDVSGGPNITTDAVLYPSLFLFDETCTSTATGPIFDIHPCIIGATAGNAVDNRIMRTKLLALGLHAMDHQSSLEEDISTARVAKDLANQLQVVTQDIAAAQKQRLGRMLASSALVLGSRQIWRVDPTGQFWDCHATVLGANADRMEEEFYKRLLEECESKKVEGVRELLDSISQDEALSLVKDFLETRIAAKLRKKARSSPQPSKETKSVDNDSDTEPKGAKSKDSLEPDLSSQVYWQAMILDYSSLTRRGTPRRKSKRGVFGVPNKV